MAAKNVRNNHTGPLNVGGVEIRPGATARVNNWERAERAAGVRTWLSLGLISTSDPNEAPAPLPVVEPVAIDGPPVAPSMPGMPVAPSMPGMPGMPGMPPVTNTALTEDEQKDALIAELAKRGIKRTRKTPLENLQRLLNDAKSK